MVKKRNSGKLFISFDARWVWVGARNHSKLTVKTMKLGRAGTSPDSDSD